MLRFFTRLCPDSRAAGCFSASAQLLLSAAHTAFQLCLKSSSDTQVLRWADFPVGSHSCFEKKKKERKNTRRCFDPGVLLVPLLQDTEPCCSTAPSVTTGRLPRTPLKPLHINLRAQLKHPKAPRGLSGI